MKRLLLVLGMIVSINAIAQSGAKEDIDIIQSSYGKSKQDLVKTYMDLKEQQAAAFEKVYEAYEAERKVLGRKRMDLLNEYVTNYATLTDEKAHEIAKATLKNNMAYEKLYSKYYDKVKKAVGAVNAAKFIQLETALQTAIKGETQDAIPFIGEIDRSKKNQGP